MTVKALETIHNLEKLTDELYSAQKQYERQANNERIINGDTKKYEKLKGKSEGIEEVFNWVSQFIEYHNTETTEKESSYKVEKLCPLLLSGANQHSGVYCKEEKCMWWRKYAGDCTISLMADMFADSDMCRTIFEK